MKHFLHSLLVLSSLLCLIPKSLLSQHLLYTNDAQISSRALGMGQAFCALANDASAFAYNPGGMVLEKSIVMSGMYASLHGSLGTPLANQTWGGLHYALTDWAVSANWIRYQSMDQLTNPRLDLSDLDVAENVVKTPRTNSFSPEYEDAISLSVARNNILRIDWGWNQYILPIEIPVGCTMRYTHGMINGLGGSSFSIDAGMLCRINLRDMFFSDDYPYVCFGWNWKNIGGSTMNWKSGQKDAFASHSVVGVSVIQPLESLESQLSIDYDHDSRSQASSRIGMEWTYRKYYSLRCGFYGSAFCAGIGADLRFFVVDYSYQSSSETILGVSHHLNLAFRLERLFL